MKKKALKSTRNRHTGRINHMVQTILDSSDGSLSCSDRGYLFKRSKRRFRNVDGSLGAPIGYTAVRVREV